jgi:hypothetical protein
MTSQSKDSLTESGFKSYQMFLAIQRHFTTKSYDYHKYNGKIKTSYDTFLSRRDAYYFQKLSKHKDPKGLILSNIVRNKKLWIGDLFEENANQIYLDWKRRTDAISHTVRQDISKMKDSYHENFIVVDGQYPFIIQQYMANIITIETTSILTVLSNSHAHWKENILDNVVFPDIMEKLTKYHDFLIYDQKKIKMLVREHFDFD